MTFLFSIMSFIILNSAEDWRGQHSCFNQSPDLAKIILELYTNGKSDTERYLSSCIITFFISMCSNTEFHHVIYHLHILLTSGLKDQVRSIIHLGESHGSMWKHLWNRGYMKQTCDSLCGRTQEQIVIVIIYGIRSHFIMQIFIYLFELFKLMCCGTLISQCT